MGGPLIRTGTGATPVDLLARLLARRDLSEAQARLRLLALGVAPAAVDEAVAWAFSCGYLDDAKLAARLVERELARKPPPAAELVSDRLEARGLPREVVAQAVRAGVDSGAIATRVADYVRTMRARLPARRLYGRLVRAGHAPESVSAWLESAGQYEDRDAREDDEGLQGDR